MNFEYTLNILEVKNMENNFDDIKIVKVTLSLNEKTKEWYRGKAKSMAMDMSQLMGYVLYNWCEQQQNSEAVRIMTTMNANADTETLKTMQNENMETVTNFMKAIEEVKKLADDGKLALMGELMSKNDDDDEKQ